jgi:hypothetical protein
MNLPNVGTVFCALGTPNADGSNTWAITFFSELGPVPDLLVDDSGLTGASAAASVTTTTSATEPFQQQKLLLSAASALVSSDEVQSITVTSATAGTSGLALDTTQCGLCPVQAALSL